MVTTQDLIEMVFTPAELKKIEAGAREYDRRAEEQIRSERQDVVKYPNFYQDMEKEELADMAFISKDIALMAKIRETFPDSGAIRAYCEHFIRCGEEELIETAERVEHARRQAENA